MDIVTKTIKWVLRFIIIFGFLLIGLALFNLGILLVHITHLPGPIIWGGCCCCWKSRVLCTRGLGDILSSSEIDTAKNTLCEI